MSPTKKKEWVRLCVYGMAFVCLVVGAYVLKGMRQDQTRLAAFTAASRESHIEFQARETFLLCSRDPARTVSVQRRTEVAEVCHGYETIERAIATERAKQKAATG